MKKMIFKRLVKASAGILCAAAMAASLSSVTAFAVPESEVTGIVTTIPNLETTAPQTVQTQPEAETIEEAVTTTALPYEEPLTDDEEAQNLLDQLNINESSTTIDLVILITILSLAPSILVMLTCFTRIIISFS
ncbi:MAG: hypothetical protein IJ261_05135, partial [Clostridia bacterium]|nr:hypothetical protein [Clostridia bacterium]